jgi:hypothetical protein
MSRELIEQAKREILGEQLGNTQAAIAAAEQAKQKYLQTQIASLRPIVVECLKNQEAYDQNEANVGILTKFIVEHKIAATAANIRQAISQCGLSKKPPLEGQGLRDSLEKGITELLVASPAERERERQSYHARLSMNRNEIQTKRHSGPYLMKQCWFRPDSCRKSEGVFS